MPWFLSITAYHLPELPRRALQWTTATAARSPHHCSHTTSLLARHCLHATSLLARHITACTHHHCSHATSLLARHCSHATSLLARHCSHATSLLARHYSHTLSRRQLPPACCLHPGGHSTCLWLCINPVCQLGADDHSADQLANSHAWLCAQPWWSRCT